jgi:hypothetical protein
MIDEKSALWPHDNAAFIGDAAREFAFGIFIMRTPVRPPISLVVGAADSADFSASAFPFISQHNASLQWNRQKAKLYIFTRREYDKLLWNYQW